MSTAETTIDSETKVYEIAIDSIHSDESFNCRGYIPPSNVIELARDIDVNGLQYPIIVQRYDDAHREKTGKDYRVISGHRRLMAHVVLKRERVSAIIREGITELDALIMNLNENTQREELNILQESKAVQRLTQFGLTQEEIAKKLQKSRPWVQVRTYVVKFPEDIQEAIGDGWINQSQIHQLNQLPDDEHRYAAVRKIKDQKLAEGSKRIKIKVEQPVKPAKRENLFHAKERKTEQVGIMLEHVMDTFGPCFATRALAWCAGNISTLDFLKDLEEQMKAVEKPYAFPTEGIPGL